MAKNFIFTPPKPTAPKEIRELIDPDRTVSMIAFTPPPATVNQYGPMTEKPDQSRDLEPKTLNIKTHRAEFGLWNWAARERGLRTAGKALAIAPFAVEILNESVREEVRQAIAAGREIPQWVADELQKLQKTDPNSEGVTPTPSSRPRALRKKTPEYTKLLETLIHEVQRIKEETEEPTEENAITFYLGQKQWDTIAAVEPDPGNFLGYTAIKVDRPDYLRVHV